jgi:hypothetical protein
LDRHHPNGDVQAGQDDGLMETAREDKHGGLLSCCRERVRGTDTRR